jgi:hypothetical protein
MNHQIITLGEKENKRFMKEFKMKILNWIQGWSGQLNSWAWTKWDKLHRQDWVEGYNEWKNNE